MIKSKYIKVLMIFICIGTTFIYSQNVPTTVKEMYGVDEVTILNGPNPDKTTGGKWTAGTNMPHARYYGGSVVYTRNDTSWLYVLGGDTTGGGVATATCLRYNINTDTWEYIAPMPEPLRNNAAALLGDKIYTMGGFNASFPSPAVTSFYEYDINTDTWTTLPDLPVPLFFHGAFGFEDSLIYILGGIEDLLLQDRDRWSGDRWSIEVRYFNVDELTFTQASDMLEATAGFGHAVIGRDIIVTAGLKSPTELWDFTLKGSIDINIRSNINWSFRTNYSLSVYAHYGVAFPNNEIYFAGGSNTTGFTPIDNVFEYNVDTDVYKPRVNLPIQGMAYFSGVNYNPEEWNTEKEVKVVIAGGITPGPTVSNQTWIFTDTVEVVGINKIENTIPEDYALFQNYPNPFNPSTLIQFALPRESYVNLEVFNALGEKVEVLVSEEMSAGTYKYEWNAEDLTSGIYFYRLQAGGFIDTKKMILLR